MKTILSRISSRFVTTLGALLLAAITAQAQPAPATGKSFVQSANEERLYQVTVYSAKPEMWSEALRFIKDEVVPANVKGGRKHMEVWTSVFGQAYESWFILPLENFAALDKPDETLLKGMGSREAVAAFWNKARNYNTSVRQFVIRVRPEQSYIKPNAPTPRLANFGTVEVTYGRRLDYENWAKSDVLPAYKKAGQYGQLRASVLGADAAFSSLTITPQENFAALDQPDVFDQAFGKEGAAKVYAKMQGVITRIERRVLIFRPDLSILPK
jgi:hypothetical protein